MSSNILIETTANNKAPTVARIDIELCKVLNNGSEN